MPVRTEIERMRDHLYKALAIAEQLCTAQDPKEVEQKSQVKLASELHRFAWNWHRVNEKRLIHHSKLMEFLSLRCGPEEAMRILEFTRQIGWLEQQPNSLLFLPKHRGLLPPNDDSSK